MNMKHITLLLLILILLMFLPALAMAKEKPNIVYILVDNWGWGDISIQGGTMPTPQIDRLATE
jgi:hypothetical protein